MPFPLQHTSSSDTARLASRPLAHPSLAGSFGPPPRSCRASGAAPVPPSEILYNFFWPSSGHSLGLATDCPPGSRTARRGNRRLNVEGRREASQAQSCGFIWSSNDARLVPCSPVHGCGKKRAGLSGRRICSLHFLGSLDATAARTWHRQQHHVYFVCDDRRTSTDRNPTRTLIADQCTSIDPAGKGTCHPSEAGGRPLWLVEWLYETFERAG